MRITNRIQRTVQSLLVFTLLTAFAGEAFAQKRPGKKNRATSGRHSLFDPGELGATRGKYEAWDKGTLGGGFFYTKADRNLKMNHANICDKIRQAMVEDRIGDEEGWKLIDGVIELGKRAKAQRGDADALNDAQKKEISAELKAIAMKAKDAATDNVDPKIQTPTLNRKQVKAGELMRFGKDSEMLSTAEFGKLERSADRLLDKEKKAKDDKEVTDRERESLVDDANELTKDLIKALAR